MQIDCYDYSENEVGCCLNCPSSYPGCLCYECKCKKCYWYGSSESGGWCEKIDVLKKERKNKIKLKYLIEEFKRKNLLKKLSNENKIIIETKKGQEDLINEYTCQECGATFYTKEDKKITLNIAPKCNICLGKINLDKKEIEEIELKAKEESKNW